MANNFINTKHIREFGIKFARDNRTGWMPERMSQTYLDDLNTKVRLLVQRSILQHPTRGKTIKYLF